MKNAVESSVFVCVFLELYSMVSDMMVLSYSGVTIVKFAFLRNYFNVGGADWGMSFNGFA